MGVTIDLCQCIHPINKLAFAALYESAIAETCKNSLTIIDYGDLIGVCLLPYIKWNWSLLAMAGLSPSYISNKNDLLYSFPEVICEVAAIQINYHVGSSSNDALDIRERYSTAAPPWLKGVASTCADSPPASEIKEMRSNPLAFEVERYIHFPAGEGGARPLIIRKTSSSK